MSRVMQKKLRAHTVWMIWTLIVGIVAFQGAKTMRLPSSKRWTPSPFEKVAPYPRARWRLATQAELEPSLVWVSHILIRYEGVDSAVPFSAPGWHNGLPAPVLSREQALAKAQALAGELRAHPDLFASYAEQFSEDVPTRSSGGSLGGVSAYQLSFWAPILDALSALAPNQVSEPVETEYGFHVLLRRAAPELQTVTGAHIVIGHDDARWLHTMLARGGVPSRTRSDAQALAQALYERVRKDPAEFGALVDHHSEHRDAAQGGDLGTWSSREVTPYPRQVEVLQSLPVGGVATPIETLMGFEILMRLPNRPRKEYAMSTIGLIFDPLAEDGAALSRSTVLTIARTLTRALKDDPSRFEEFQGSYCCAGISRWRQGAELPELDEPLEQLAMGQIAPEPIESIRQYLIPMRLDPRALPKLEVRLGLPTPEHPDIPYWVGQMSPGAAREHLRQFARASLPSLNLGLDETAWLLQLHDQPWEPAMDRALVEKRTEAFQAFLQKLERNLPPDRYGTYQRLLEQDVADVVLHGRAL